MGAPATAMPTTRGSTRRARPQGRPATAGATATVSATDARDTAARTDRGRTGSTPDEVLDAIWRNARRSVRRPPANAGGVARVIGLGDSRARPRRAGARRPRLWPRRSPWPSPSPTPGARLLAPALDTLADVLAGDWAGAARLCAAQAGGTARVRSRPGRRRRARRRRAVAAPAPTPTGCTTGSWSSTSTRPSWRRRSTSTCGCGPGSGTPSSRSRPRVRGPWWGGGRWSCSRSGSAAGSPTPGRGALATQSLFLAPPHARLAHQVLGELEGGTARHQYDVPAGPAVVHLS